jgi:uncharacterized protein (DUF1697 family)
MTRYAALLRGINLGSRNRIPMADLRALLSGMGLADVRTHLQSGNVVFDSGTGPEPLRSRIETAIRQQFGFEVACLVRTRDELRGVIEGNPLADVATNGSRLMALFLSEAPDPELLARNNPVTLDPEGVRIGRRVIYQWCPNGLMAAPPVGAFVEKHLKLTVTARNWNTVTKLGSMMDT